MIHDEHDPFPPASGAGATDGDVGAARARVRRRLERRRRTRLAGAGGVVAVLALSTAVAVAARSGDPRDEAVSSGGGPPASSTSSPSDLLPGSERIEGVECGVVPVEASAVGIELAVTGPLTFPVPASPGGRVSTSVTVRNRNDTPVRLTGPGEINVVLIDADGAIASSRDPSLVAGTIPVDASSEVEVPGLLPLNSCDQADVDRLAPGSYDIAPVALVRVDGGEVAVVRGDLAVVTYG